MYAWAVQSLKGVFQPRKITAAMIAISNNSRRIISETGRKGRVRAMEIVNSLKRVKRRGRHARLPRKAVEPRCYICVHLVYLCFKRLVPTEENHGRNDQDYNQQSSHDHRDWQNLTVEVNLISVITRAQSETAFQFFGPRGHGQTFLGAERSRRRPLDPRVPPQR